MANREKSPILVPWPNNRSPLRIVPQSLLHDCLVRGEGAPLESSIRSFMESRFRATFGDVRIHTGASAGALCDAMEARALTLGRDIVFGAGQYAPGSLHGRRLLAHELGHVLQQRAATPRAISGLVKLGGELDPCESEAERLAEEALGTGIRSAVTPDGSGAMRPAVRVMNTTAGIRTRYQDTDASGTRTNAATPGMSFIHRGPTDIAVLHLTSNSAGILQTPPRVVGPNAINFTATVFLFLDRQSDDIRGEWSFRFIQLFGSFKNIAFYAGRTSSDGSMSLDFAGPKYFRSGYQKFLLDSEPRLAPFFGKRGFDLAKHDPKGLQWMVTLSGDDHPFSDYSLWLPNHAANDSDNFLYRVEREYQVITAFVALDRNTLKWQILAHVKWGVTCEADLHWTRDQVTQDNIPSIAGVTGSFKVEPALLGPPTDHALEAMVLNAGQDDPMYNSESRAAMRAVMGANVSDLDVDLRKSWSPKVPDNHFRP